MCWTSDGPGYCFARFFFAAVCEVLFCTVLAFPALLARVTFFATWASFALLGEALFFAPPKKSAQKKGGPKVWSPTATSLPFRAQRRSQNSPLRGSNSARFPRCALRCSLHLRVNVKNPNTAPCRSGLQSNWFAVDAQGELLGPAPQPSGRSYTNRGSWC